MGTVEKVFDKITENFNILVNCAGVYPTTDALGISGFEWAQVLTLDLTSTIFYVAKKQLKGGFLKVSKAPLSKLVRPLLRWFDRVLLIMEVLKQV
ncbi:hypothetical protein [Alicyclobacillus suci]|uniref:hypothetical protein n=1 Tax=Alicyclobacillus suci TaxID=2816080 RepID=UPI001F45506D|nr:hypothetical protein [Alicyclobacillus suci]